MGIIPELRWWGAKKRWPRNLEAVGDVCRRADEAISMLSDEVLRLRTVLSEAETDARSPFTIVADWHDKQARWFKEMSQDDRIGELGKAKAAAAAKHHAGSAAAMRLQAINERQRALQAEEP